jgi:hypothetical protein
MSETKAPAPQRVGRRTVLGGAIAAVVAALSARRPGRDRRRGQASGQPAEPKRPIWIGHI